MNHKIAIVASSIHPIKQRHLIDWYYDVKSTGLNCQLFIGSKDKDLPEAINFKLNSKKEKIKYFFKGKKPKKIQPLLDYKPDVIHLLTSNAFSHISSFLLDKKIKLIVSFRGYDINVFPGLSDDNLKKTKEIFDRADVLHFNSESLMTRAINLGADRKKCIVIYRSVRIDQKIDSIKKRQYVKNATIRILSVGRLVWEKGYVYGLESLSILKNNGAEFQYFIAGDGIDENLIRYHIQRLNLNENVCLLGLVPKKKIQELMSQSDIFFQSSLIESLPNSVIEASLAGLPIVSSNAGGVSEVVKNNESGFISEICKPEAYADSLEKLILDKELRLKMGKRGKEIAFEKFNRVNEVNHWIELYKKISENATETEQ